MIVFRLQGPIYRSRGPVDKSCLPTVWQTASNDHPLKLTSSRPQMIQSFVILLQLIPWLQTVTPPQEGYRDPKWSVHTRKTHNNIYTVMISSLTLCGWLVSPSAAIPRLTICPGWDIGNHHFKCGKVLWNANSAARSILFTEGNKVKWCSRYTVLSLSP